MTDTGTQNRDVEQNPDVEVSFEEAIRLVEERDRSARASANADQEVAARLRAARERHFKTAKGFTRKHEINYSVYYSHERGDRALNNVTARRYAELLDVPVEEILGKKETWLLRRRVILIVGTISDTSARVIIMPDGGNFGAFDYGEPADPDIPVIAIAAVDDALRPFLGKDYKLLAEPMSETFDPTEMNDRLCFYRLADGLTSLAAQLKLQPNGRWTIFQFKGETLYDQKVVAATRVRAIIPN